MFNRTGFCSLILVAIVSVLTPAAAAADPIVITSGSILTNNGSSFSFTGDGLSLAGSLDNGPKPLWTVCFPCPDGPRPVVLQWGGDMGAAAGTVGGTAYPHLWLGGQFGISGTASLPVDGPALFTVGFPFSVMPGSYLLGWTNAQRNDAPVVRIGVTGSGTGALTLTRFPDSSRSLYDAQSAQFDFGPESPSPTPEPTTVLLFASGLVVAGARRSRRR